MESKRIENVVIVGMGALGLLYGNCIRKNLGKEHVSFLMDAKRFARHSRDVYTINGESVEFQMTTPERVGETDLVIFATKYGALQDAIREAGNAVGKDTVILSILNGIITEDIIGGVYGMEKMVDSVPIGMDAMREGTTLHYTKAGKLQIGVRGAERRENLERVTEFFDRAGVSYEVMDDIRRAMWNKFMINVGTNQTCMVYETTYGGSMKGQAYEDQKAAMHEVITVAEAEGVKLTEDDYAKDIAILNSLNPDSYPSMRQDAVAKRKSEVELFSGTLIRLAKKHGLRVPVNEKYYRKIQEIESRY